MTSPEYVPTARTINAARLGPFGVWRRGSELDSALASTIESLGFGALWIGGSPGEDLTQVEDLLDATESLTIATGIANMWHDDPVVLAASYRRVVARHPGRFILGIGSGHREASGAKAAKPYDALVSYLDVLDGEGVARDDLVLAALGPRMLALAAERTAGAHPYLVTPRHTAEARRILGADAVLAPEQRVVLRADPDAARAIGRPTIVTPYLGMANYLNSFVRQGFSAEDIAGEGTDRLIDELVVYGDDATIAARLGEHLAAGADHVAVQLLTAPGEDPAAEFAALADALELRGAPGL